MSRTTAKKLVMECEECLNVYPVKSFHLDLDKVMCNDCYEKSQKYAYRYTLNTTAISYDFYKDYLMKYSHKEINNILKKEYKENDEDCYCYVMYLKNNHPCYYNCLFLMQSADGVLPIYVSDINTSSCMAMCMSGLFDDDCEDLMSLDEIIEMTSKGFKKSVKKIIETEN